MRHSRVGRRVPYRTSSRLNTRVEWLGEEQRRGGIVGPALAVQRLSVGAWRWGRWLFAVFVAPFVLIGYWWVLVLGLGIFGVVFVCIGKPRMMLELIEAIPLVPPNLRGLLVPPRTGLVQRAFRVMTRWW